MEIEVKRADVDRALGPIMRATNARSSMLITSCVRLRAESGALELEATRIDQIARVTVEADVSKAGECAVDAKTFAVAVKKAPGETLRIVLDNARVVVTSGKSRTTLPALAVEDWPPAPTAKAKAAWFTVRPEDLAHLLGASYAATDDPSRPHLGVVHVEAVGGRLVAVGTDGNRMAVHEAAVDAGKVTAEIPTIAAPLIIEACSGAESARVTVDGAYLHVAAGDVTVAVKLADTSFPPWRSLVDASEKVLATKARLPRSAALGAVDRAGAVLEGRDAAALVRVGEGALAMRSEDIRGQVDDEVPADVDGPALSIGVRMRYLRDAFAAMRGDEVSIEFGAENHDAIIVRDLDGARLNVTMPTRL